MDLLHLVDRLEELVGNAQKMPIGNRAMVDRRRMLDIIDQMRVVIPPEVREAQEIVAQRDAIAREAEEEGRLLVAHAEEQAARLVEAHEITERARRRADEIAEQARTRLEEEIQRANADIADRMEESRRLAQDQMAAADEYALELLRRLDRQLSAFVRSVRSGMEQLEPRETFAADVAALLRGDAAPGEMVDDLGDDLAGGGADDLADDLADERGHGAAAFATPAGRAGMRTAIDDLDRAARDLDRRVEQTLSDHTARGASRGGVDRRTEDRARAAGGADWSDVEVDGGRWADPPDEDDTIGAHATLRGAGAFDDAFDDGSFDDGSFDGEAFDGESFAGGPVDGAERGARGRGGAGRRAPVIDDFAFPELDDAGRVPRPPRAGHPTARSPRAGEGERPPTRPRPGGERPRIARWDGEPFADRDEPREDGDGPAPVEGLGR